MGTWGKRCRGKCRFFQLPTCHKCPSLRCPFASSDHLLQLLISLAAHLPWCSLCPSSPVHLLQSLYQPQCPFALLPINFVPSSYLPRCSFAPLPLYICLSPLTKMPIAHAVFSTFLRRNHMQTHFPT